MRCPIKVVIDEQALVYKAVAVVIDAIAGLRCPEICISPQVVAVIGAAFTASLGRIQVPVFVCGKALICLGVAIVVDTIAGLKRPWMHQGVGIVAVTRVGAVCARDRRAEAVAIVVDSGAGLGNTIAVFVHVVVARLQGVDMNLGVGVVAVGI
jgi:hypothetical protein